MTVLGSRIEATSLGCARMRSAFTQLAAVAAFMLSIHQTWAYRCDDPRFAKKSPEPGQPATQEAMYEGLTHAYEAIATELGVSALADTAAISRLGLPRSTGATARSR